MRGPRTWRAGSSLPVNLRSISDSSRATRTSIPCGICSSYAPRSWSCGVRNAAPAADWSTRSVRFPRRWRMFPIAPGSRARRSPCRPSGGPSWRGEREAVVLAADAERASLARDAARIADQVVKASGEQARRLAREVLLLLGVLAIVLLGLPFAAGYLVGRARTGRTPADGG